MSTSARPPGTSASARPQGARRGAFRGSGSRVGPRSETRFPQTLRALYERYREVEVRELLPLLPREGLRSLWRSRGRAGQNAGDPPSLDRLREIAAGLLPLPPYEVWVTSYLADREPYLRRLGIHSAPSRPDPVTVDTRRVHGEIWAHLNLVHRRGEWVGFIRFHRETEGAGPRTADVFRGEDPTEIRDRFREFTSHTLRAFLRSVGG